MSAFLLRRGVTSPLGNILKYDGTIMVSGGNFVNSSGAIVQPRGSSLSGFEDAAIQGVNAPDSSGGTSNFDQAYGPNIARLKTWKGNCWRVPINEASWLGYTCYDALATGTGTTGWHTTALGNLNGTSVAGATYQQNIINLVAALNAAGCYVIIDMHFTAPGRIVPIGQDSMANQDNTLQCWQSIAGVFGYPNGTALKRNGGTVDNRSVMFELFNEPYLGNIALTMNGGFYNGYVNYSADGALGGYQQVFPYFVSSTTGTFLAGENFTSTAPTAVTGIIMAPVYTNTTVGFSGSGLSSIYLYNQTRATHASIPIVNQGTIAANTVIHGSTSGATATISSATYGYHIAGHQQMLSAIRAASAQNVCLLSGEIYNSDLSGWLANVPTDSLGQIAASWHPYPVNTTGVTGATVASGGSGYAVNDTITLQIPLTGQYANSVWQLAAVLKVASVSAGAVTGVTAVTNTTTLSGTSVSGTYSPIGYQTSAVPQASSSGSGSGATFNLTLPTVTYSWATQANLATVAAFRPSYPVCITETGDYYSYTETGITGASWWLYLMSWCDTNNIGMIPWSYNPPYASAGSTGTYYIIGYDYNPTPGFGKTVFNTFTAHAP